MSRLSLLLCCALLGLAPGCSKRGSDASAAAPESGGGSGGGSGGATYDTVASESPAPAPAPMEASHDDEYAAKDSSGGDAPVTVQAAPARPAGNTTPVTGKITEPPRSADAKEGQGAAEKEPDKKQYARQIIYTAEMQISVYKLEDAMQRAEELTLAVGGYIQNLSQGYYVLRIPAPALRGVMNDLARLGVVEARTLQASDVTEQYVDLTTRIKVLRETQAQLLALLKQARNVEEALKVRQSVDAVTMELEQAMGRLRMLESMIGFSTLTVRMSQRGPQNTVPSSNDPFPWVDGLGVEATEWN